MPCRNTIYEHFGKIRLAGSSDECERAVHAVFDSLNEGQKTCFISFDEIHIKPGLHYQGKYILGKALNSDSQLPANSMLGRERGLAFMIYPSFGAPAFAARLIPVRNLTAEFVVEQLLVLITLIHKCGGYVFCLMSDNLR